ncbi:HNH endonuclease signature motif containing protein [Paraburkholderia ferrariae]|uniref:HNH endonuclease signature motif containing protein n=1 Tax=Paraburkholderia ferrariae TaxID=386056 RepID=UPI00157AEA75|nr:HNH endonuclease signature motif containing protein [Paraburkholderia ferrariae]
MEIESGLFTARHVKKAGAMWRKQPGYGGFQNARHYEVVIDGAGYPVKAIVAIALELAGERLLMPSDFPGRFDGRWHRELKALGFEIRAKRDGAFDMSSPSITAAELLSIITSLGAPVVITKNHKRTSEKNFHVDPSNPKQWLDGDWKGVPQEVEPKDAYVLHWVVHRSLVCIGRYLGTVAVGPDRNCLILDQAYFYEIADANGTTEAHEQFRAILKQPGPVTYSYYRPDVSAQIGTPTQRYRRALARLQQPAFREAVIAHYGHKCIVTSCATEALLDAAHLPGRDWRSGHNKASDGIPLRVDLHRALDRGLIKLNWKHELIWTSPELHGIYDEYLVKSNGDRGS